MHYALKSVIPSAQVIAAFDINDVANDVYEHNFKFRPKQVRKVESELSVCTTVGFNYS